MHAASYTGDEFVITDVFAAPRAIVFKAWTDAEDLRKWFGPKGFVMSSCRNDMRPGGTMLYSLLTPNGTEMWGKWSYREIIKPEKIVLVNSFSDAQGGLTRHPMVSTWPLEMLSEFTFDEQGNKTLVTVRWQPINATEEEWKTFLNSKDGMRQGWTGTFEQLHEYLEKE